MQPKDNSDYGKVDSQLVWEAVRTIPLMVLGCQGLGGIHRKDFPGRRKVSLRDLILFSGNNFQMKQFSQITKHDFTIVVCNLAADRTIYNYAVGTIPSGTNQYQVCIINDGSVPDVLLEDS